jgi:uncharacterized RDD family membrane protein YckC
MPAAPRAKAPRPEDLAEYPTRALAAIVDALVSGLIGLAVAAVVYVVVVLLGHTATHAGHVVRDNALLIGIPVGLLYAPLLMARQGARNGQTIGKQMLHIRVVRERLAPMDIPVGLLREALGKQVLAAITFSIYAIADYLWPLADAERQALHDKVAQTWVVRARVAAPLTSVPEPDHLLAERGALKREGPRPAPPPVRVPPPRPEPERAPEPAPVPDAPLPGGWLPPVPPAD